MIQIPTIDDVLDARSRLAGHAVKTPLLESPALNARVIAQLNRAEAAVAALPQPFDQVLASPKGSAERKIAEEAVAAFKDLAEALKDAGAKLGVLVTTSDK